MGGRGWMLLRIRRRENWKPHHTHNPHTHIKELKNQNGINFNVSKNYADAEKQPVVIFHTHKKNTAFI